MIEQRDVCPTSGGFAGATKWTPAGHRKGWCGRCDRWVPLTPGGKVKRHATKKLRSIDELLSAQEREQLTKDLERIRDAVRPGFIGPTHNASKGSE